MNVQTIDAAARDVLSLPDVFELPALIAVGYPGELDDLPEDYRAREKPSDRKPLNELLFENDFSGLWGAEDLPRNDICAKSRWQ